MKIGDVVECKLPGSHSLPATIGVIVDFVEDEEHVRRLSTKTPMPYRAMVLTEKGIKCWWLKNLRVLCQENENGKWGPSWKKEI